MFSIRAANLTEFPVLDNLQKVSDLIFRGHPLLSHLQTPQGTNYLELWCDEDKTGHRTLLFAVEPGDLDAFRNREITLRRLLERAREGVTHLIERGQGGKTKAVKTLPTDSIPDEYMPTKDSYYQF